jgi:quercetin dioxygenase-like cupin family protein
MAPAWYARLMQLQVIRWDGTEPPTERELRERLAAEGFEAFLWRDEPGADYQPHAHDHDESLWVVDGEIAFGVGGEEHRLRTGDRLNLPKGTVHTAHAGAAGATYLIGEH